MRDAQQSPCERIVPRDAVPLEATGQWLGRLREQGFAVIKDIASEEQVTEGKALLWDWLESLGSGISRHNPTTWGNANWPGPLALGFAPTHGGGQCQAAWHFRGLPRVKEAFAAIWETNDLICSLDSPILWRPWWAGAPQRAGDVTWEPRTEGLHCDQNPHTRRGFHCVQGMIPLCAVTPDIGGLEVVPRTHDDATQAYLREEYSVRAGIDWLRLHPADKFQVTTAPL